MSPQAGQTGTCPHCRTGVRFEVTTVAVGGQTLKTPSLRILTPSNLGMDVDLSACPVCGRPILDIERLYSGSGSTGGPGTVYPVGVGRPLPAEVHNAAAELATDFAEAVAVLSVSRKASAAMSRRCLQYVLVSAGKAKKRDLADQIEELLASLPPQIAENVDAIRQVGNFASHPIKSTNSAEIVDVEEGEAEWLLDVLEELFDFYYVAPARAAAKRAALNEKLQAVGKPPLKRP